MTKKEHGCQYILAQFIYGPQRCGILGGTRNVKIDGEKVRLCKRHRKEMKPHLKKTKK